MNHFSTLSITLSLSLSSFPLQEMVLTVGATGWVHEFYEITLLDGKFTTVPRLTTVNWYARMLYSRRKNFVRSAAPWRIQRLLVVIDVPRSDHYI